MDNIQILIAEDDDGIREGLQFALEQEGYRVIPCACAAEAEEKIAEGRADLCLLDVTLPDGTGYELCRLVRERDRRMPVIFLTACDAEVNVVMGLDMGADDYITKPFRVRELVSRIRSVLRRCEAEEPGTEAGAGTPAGAGARRVGFGSGRHSAAEARAKDRSIIPFGNVTIYLAEARAVRTDGPEVREVQLTALEYRLLLTFARHPGQVLSRSQLMESIWDAAGDFAGDNTVSVYIKRLREKLEEDPRNPRLIQTVRGFGYRSASK